MSYYLNNKARSNISLILQCSDPKNLDDVAKQDIAAEIVLNTDPQYLIDYALIYPEIVNKLCLLIKETNEEKRKEKESDLIETMKKSLVEECKNQIEDAIDYYLEEQRQNVGAYDE